MELYDAVVCLGPNDVSLLGQLLRNFRANLVGCGVIYVICSAAIAVPVDISGVKFIDEAIFPFSISVIDAISQKTGRGGWYFQQLLKLYAASVIPELQDNFLIVDADVYFHRPIRWFQDNKVQFNIGTHFHRPYFLHMERFVPFLKKKSHYSGICHLMPMKREIVCDFLRRCEELHKKPAWMPFIEKVEYYHSGASEYELLFEFGLTFYSDACTIRPLSWLNSPSITMGYEGDYEACHHYMRG